MLIVEDNVMKLLNSQKTKSLSFCSWSILSTKYQELKYVLNEISFALAFLILMKKNKLFTNKKYQIYF